MAITRPFGPTMFPGIVADNDGRITWIGQVVQTPDGLFRNVITFGATGDGVTDDAPAFAEAIAEGPGTVYVPPGTYLLGSAVALDVDNVRLWVDAGATLVKGANGNLITVTADRVCIDGGGILNGDDNVGARTGPGIVIDGAADVCIDNLQITRTQTHPIRVQNSCQRIRVTRCRLFLWSTGSASPSSAGVSIVDSVDVAVQANEIDTSLIPSAGGTDVHNVEVTSVAVVVRRVEITDNRIFIGSSTSFGVRIVGASGALPVREVLIANNDCRVTTNGAGGFVAMVPASPTAILDVLIDGNLFDAVGNDVNEGVGVSGETIIVSDNLWRGITVASPGRAVLISAARGVVVSGNTMEDMASPLAGSVILVTSVGAALCEDIAIVGNRIEMATGQHDGIQLNAGDVTSNVSSVQISGNLIRGVAGQTQRGVVLTAAAGSTMDAVTVEGNTFDSLQSGMVVLDVDATAVLVSGNNYANPGAGLIVSGTSGVGHKLSDINGIVFASLPTPANGSLLFCTDCTIANPCAGGGTGALAKRLNGAWVCN